MEVVLSVGEKFLIVIIHSVLLIVYAIQISYIFGACFKSGKNYLINNTRHVF